ncbi:MAG: hypothetical protein HY208_09705 [Nitrospirae bacterium]|nr:hypothetical protein [Nitrospirota bacterium]
MRCRRCGGMMHREWFVTRESEQAAEPYEGWRCLSCGEVLDPIILRNRRVLKRAPAVEPVHARHQVA